MTLSTHRTQIDIIRRKYENGGINTNNGNRFCSFAAMFALTNKMWLIDMRVKLTSTKHIYPKLIYGGC